MSQIATTIFSNYTVAAGASSWVDLDFSGVTDAQLMLSMTYNGTHASATGLNLRLKAGMGKLDTTDSDITAGSILYALGPGSFAPSITFADNYDTVSSIPAFPLAFPSSITINHYFYLNNMPNTWPAIIKLELINTDATHPCSVTLRANL